MTKTNQAQDAHAVTVELDIAAKPENVFKALTEAKHVQHWWASKATVDAKPGGRYTVAFEFDDAAKNMTQDVAITRIEAPRLVAISWEHPMPGPESVATFTVTPAKAGTTLRLDHTGFQSGPGWDDYRAKIQDGWDYYLGNLKSVLESGKDLRVGTGQKIHAT